MTYILDPAESSKKNENDIIFTLAFGEGDGITSTWAWRNSSP